MAKRLNTTYWSGAQLKTDADIPAQIDMSTAAGYCDCTNISFNAVKTLLNSSTNTLWNLCNTDASFCSGDASLYINAWSRYKPGSVEYDTELPTNCYDNPTFIYNKPNVGSLGSFAGYNHSETTKPVYWEGPPSSDIGNIIDGNTYTIRNGLSRGKLCPVIQGDTEDETYWSYVKVQAYLKEGAGSYSLAETSEFVDLNSSGEESTSLYTCGIHSETVGNTYYVSLRPVYIQTDASMTALAVCEGGVALFQYKYVTPTEAANLSVTDNGSASSHPSQYTNCAYNFYLNSSINITLDVRVRAEDQDAWFNYDHVVGYDVEIEANTPYNFANNFDLGVTLYDGFFNLQCDVRFNSGSWYSVGTITTLEHWASV